MLHKDVKSQAYTRAFKIKSELKGRILGGKYVIY